MYTLRYLALIGYKIWVASRESRARPTSTLSPLLHFIPSQPSFKNKFTTRTQSRLHNHVDTTSYWEPHRNSLKVTITGR